MNPPANRQFETDGANRSDLLKLAEQLAPKVHKAWVRQRQAEGWTYGKERNDRLKETPCLVEFDQLPENEKEVDRNTALTTIQGLVDLGYEIVPREGQRKAGDETRVAALGQQLAGVRTMSLAELRNLWRQCGALEFCPPDVHLVLGDRILRKGEPILAYDVLSKGLSALEQGGPGENDGGAARIRLAQLVALALAQSGASELARIELLELCAQGHDTPETCGLLGRVYKDLAGRAPSDEKRQEFLGQSFESYFAGFQRADTAYKLEHQESDAGDAYYCGINAAAVEVFRGRVPEARVVAGRVQEICRAQMQPGTGDGKANDYWLAATLAEAALICGQPADARQWYQAANHAAQGNWRELCSTRKQARLLAPRLGLAPGVVGSFFPRLSVVAFAAPRLDAAVPPSQLEEWTGQTRAALRKQLEESGAICGFASAVSPGDLLFIEAMLEDRREVNVVLPFPRPVCRQAFECLPGWAARFDELLAKVDSVTEDVQESGADQRTNVAFAAMRIHGGARLRAQYLDVELRLWALAEAPWARRGQGPCALLSHWNHLGLSSEVIGSGTADPGTGARTEAEGQSIPEAPDKGGYVIRAMLFADVKGYSKLTDIQLLSFGRHLMNDVAGVLDRHASSILSRRTAGDGLFLVFDDLESAAGVALDLRDLVANGDWQVFGLPAGLGIRISLDAGLVYVYEDPVVRRTEICGSFVNRAARIEPITPPNEVYASEVFGSVYVARGGNAVRFDYVGRMELPKGFGSAPLYCVHR